MRKDFKLADLPSYKISAKLADIIYKAVRLWSFIDQKTIGLQLIRAVDSIAANIAEGFGRYHKKDKIKFFYIARASAFEVAHWVKTAKERNLFKEEEFLEIMNLLQRMPREINYLIKMTENNLSK